MPDVLPVENVGQGAFDVCDRLADQFLAGISEMPGGCGVGRADLERRNVDEEQDFAAVLEQELVEFGFHWLACPGETLLSK